MSTIVKDSNNKSTSLDTGQKLTAVRVIDIILDISHPKAIDLGGYDSIGTIFYTILKNNTPLEEIKTSNIARPIFPHLKYYPLKNEVVLILSSQDKNIYNSEGATTSYYLPSLNIWNHPHHNALPSVKGLKSSSTEQDYQQTENGIVRQVTDEGTDINLGDYFSELLKVKPLLPYEGDYILEGRFSNSIRLGSTNIGENIPDGNINNWSTSGNTGDPIIVIRNGQSDKLDDKGWVPTIEDINDDLTSIYLTSNQKLADFRVSSTNFQSYQAKIELPEDIETVLTDPELNIVVQAEPTPVEPTTTPTQTTEEPVLESPMVINEESSIVSDENKSPFDLFIANSGNFYVTEIEDRTENQQVTPGSNLSLGTSHKETESTGTVDLQEKIGNYFNLSQLIYSDTANNNNINNLPGIDNNPNSSTIIQNLKNLMINVGDKIYEKYGNITISSGYRSNILNKKLKGADNSQHTKGEALDIQIPGKNTSEIFNWAVENIPTYDQIIWEFPEKGESSWIHISYSSNNRKDKLLATNNISLQTAYNGDSTYTSISSADQSKLSS